MKAFLHKRGIRPLCLLDLALPRDIDPELDKFNNVFLYNLDDLAELAESNLKARKEELGKCMEYIDKKIQQIFPKQDQKPETGSQPGGLRQT